MLKIAYDPEILYSEKYFSQLGELIPIATGNQLQKNLPELDILLIRSNIQIDKDFLNQTKVKAICTASAGLNHIDTGYLNFKKIPVFHGKGANALAVADYVLASFFTTQLHMRVKKPTIGIIGLGNIGKAVYQRFEKLGYHCFGYDPLIDQTLLYSFCDLKTVLACDFITLHVPLTCQSSYPTFQMINEETLSYIKSNAVLINTSRAAVMDSLSVMKRLKKRNDIQLICDVWKNEPNVDYDLAKQCRICTPHIAGWSDRGRNNLVFELYKQVINHFKLNIVPKNQYAKKILLTTELNVYTETVMSSLLAECIDLESISRDFKYLLQENSADTAKAFSTMQKNYIHRNELFDYMN